MTEETTEDFDERGKDAVQALPEAAVEATAEAQFRRLYCQFWRSVGQYGRSRGECGRKVGAVEEPVRRSEEQGRRR